MTELSAFRVYASAAKSVEHLPIATLMTGVHVVLAFARDYDPQGNPQLGRFRVCFDSSFNAQKIQAIKKSPSGTNVKFFLSIGGRKSKYPFQIPSGQRLDWIKNATDSLTQIIKSYKFDGIDIYYEHITSTDDFAKAIRPLIWNLRHREKVITSASLTVSAPLINLYNELYRAGSADFDHVVYQAHSETSPISTFDDLVNVFNRLPYPKEKIFAGHSDVLSSDWEKVPLPVFLGAVPQLLEKEINSISKWIVTDNDDPER